MGYRVPVASFVTYEHKIFGAIVTEQTQLLQNRSDNPSKEITDNSKAIQVQSSLLIHSGRSSQRYPRFVNMGT